jgi:hypothetical protein
VLSDPNVSFSGCSHIFKRIKKLPFASNLIAPS